jgi:hypothetical protein
VFLPEVVVLVVGEDSRDRLSRRSREALLRQALFALLDERVTASAARSPPGRATTRRTVELFLQAQRQPELRTHLADGVSQGWRGTAGILRSEPRTPQRRRARPFPGGIGRARR